MKIFADYHTHTIYSHGKGTIRENVEAAIKKGLKEIVISDHGPGHAGFGVKRNKLIKMREEIDALNKEFDEIEIKLGVEANIISVDGDLDITKDDVELFDILLAGFHFGATPKTLMDGYYLYVRNYIARFMPSIRQECRRINTEAVVNAINKNKIDILTHPGAKIDIDTREIAKAAYKRGTVLEINSSHGYLTVDYAKIALEEGVMFSIDSDAHTPMDVGNVERGIEVAKAANIPIERIINAQK